jgi:hypothetical protein
MRALARQHKTADPVSYLRNARQRAIALGRSRCPITPQKPCPLKRASASNRYGSIMVTFEVGPPEEEDEEAMVTAADAAGLTAAAATLRPLASTAELASVTITRIRTFFISWPLPERPRASAG